MLLLWGLFLYFPAWFAIVGFMAGLILLPLLRTRDRVSYDLWDRLVRPREERGRW